jgi:hypothetical protein
MKLVRLWMLLEEPEVVRIAEVVQLAVLVLDISRTLVDLGIPPILGIPQDPGRPPMS